MTELNPIVSAVTDRVIQRSREGRASYLEMIDAQRHHGVNRKALSCGNLAHAFAASGSDKPAIRAGRSPNIGIVTAYNDMLSAHQPYGRYPEVLKIAAREVGATAQVAGGVSAMCDGVTQGQSGMELSLFSRDTIALSTAVALSHAMFEGALLLGICDKIVPGLLMGALRFGHLPMILVPGGPMPSGLPNREKARVRQLFAEGKADASALLDAEAASYHVIDIKSGAVSRTIAVGRSPHGLRMSPDHRTIYVANTDDGTVSILSVDDLAEIGRIPVGRGPVQVAFTPDGRLSYVTLRDEDGTAVIDTASRRVIATLAVGSGPIQAFATPDGREVYVANQGTEASPDNTVSVIDTATQTVVARVVTGAGAHGVVVSDDGDQVYIANSFADTVSVLDTRTRKLVRTIAVGRGPGGITTANVSD